MRMKANEDKISYLKNHLGNKKANHATLTKIKDSIQTPRKSGVKAEF